MPRRVMNSGLAAYIQKFQSRCVDETGRSEHCAGPAITQSQSDSDAAAPRRRPKKRDRGRIFKSLSSIQLALFRIRRDFFRLDVSQFFSGTSLRKCRITF